jgi:hypothetical protein
VALKLIYCTFADNNLHTKAQPHKVQYHYEQPFNGERFFSLIQKVDWLASRRVPQANTYKTTINGHTE